MALIYCCLGSESELGRVLRSSVVSRLLTRSTGSAARLLLRYRSVETGSGPWFLPVRVAPGRATITAMRAMLMRTCLADVVAPSVSRAARDGAASGRASRWSSRARQTCCGQPGWSVRAPRARPARWRGRPCGRSRGDDPVVVPSGSCAAMVVPRLPGALRRARRRRPRPAQMAGRTMELTQFLARHGLGPRPDGSGSVTYHDSCHMLRLLGERTSARAGHRAGVRGLELREMEQTDVVLRLRRHLQRQLPRGLGTAGRGEGAQRRGHRGRRAGGLRPLVPASHRRARARRTGVPLRARHLAEVLAE